MRCFRKNKAPIAESSVDSVDKDDRGLLERLACVRQAIATPATPLIEAELRLLIAREMHRADQRRHSGLQLSLEIEK